MRSSNPIFRNNAFSGQESYPLSEMPMSISGTMSKLLLLSLILLVGAGAVYYQFSLKHFDFVNMIMLASMFVGFILSFIIVFKPNSSPYLTPIYAFSQGALISGLSCIAESMLPGVVIQAATMTMIVVFAMAFLFLTGVIRATEKFRAVILIATVAVMFFYLISFIASLFGVNVAYFTSTSSIAIFVNVAIALLAAFNLILDFDFIQRGVDKGLPSLFEWYGAYGLLVTIIWLYIEVLRLFLRTKDN